VVRLSDLVAALVFLTRVPLPSHERHTHRAVPWFPLAGALIGCVVGGIAAGLWHIVPGAVAAAVAVLAGVIVTGAFHEDGLADTADALVGGWDVEQRVRILKDPLHGSYGVAALCGSIVIRVVALAAVAPAGPMAMFAVAVAVHALARTAAVTVMLVAPAAGWPGLGSDYVGDLRRGHVVAGIAAGVVIAVAATGWWSVPLAAAAAAGAGAIATWATRRIGGTTGDVLGAAEQLAECLGLVVASGLAAHCALW
jgi:adenosylcobinamide-GDP ribazoletransferase